MYRNYYNQKTDPPKPEKPTSVPSDKDCNKSEVPKNNTKTGPLDFLKSLATDDILLLIIIFLLLTDEDSDKTLLAVLGFLFISGI